MDIEVSDIVISLNGRDKGGLFFVTQADGNCVMLVNGKGRKLIKPKHKKAAHVRFVSESLPETACGIKNGKLSDRDLRTALAKYMSGAGKEEGGTYVWLKMM